MDVFVELDVGSDYNSDDEQIRSVLYNVVKEGAIASYVTSVEGFQFRRLGEGKTPTKRKSLLCVWRKLKGNSSTFKPGLCPFLRIGTNHAL